MGLIWKKFDSSVIFTFLLSIIVGYSATRFQSVQSVVTNEVSQQISHEDDSNIDDPLVVQTKYGQVSGFYASSRAGREYREYLGIPYAKAPVGVLRFEAPLAPDKWDGIREAAKYGPKCLQYDMFTDMILGSEDCLYLSVFTPKKMVSQHVGMNLSREDLYPVIVFVHGGLFMYGGSDEYRPEYYMDEDVVVVTLNYRLNSFGFLNTGDDVVRGNMGLKDQTMALRWVHENIKHFGGDPNKVTLVGQSAGGASVHYHLLSPLSKGLFHSAVSLSGNALSNWAFVKTPKEQAKRYGERLGCPTISSKDLVDCLRSLDSAEIIRSHEEIKDFLNERISHFAPSMEGVNDSNTFLAGNPEVIITSGNIASKVPWLTGVNSEEGLIYVIGLFTKSSAVQKLNKYWKSYAPKLFEYDDIAEDKRDEISMKIKGKYLNNEDISEKNIDLTLRLFQDANFNYHLHRSVLLHSKHHPVYLYYYSHKGNFGFYQIFSVMTNSVPRLLDWVWALAYRWFNYDVLGQEEVHYGACHGDENIYFFKVPLLSNLKEGSVDFYFSKSLVHTWTTFAKLGTPKEFQGIPWLPVHPQDAPLHYMRLANHSELISEPFEKSITFWKDEILQSIAEARNAPNT